MDPRDFIACACTVVPALGTLPALELVGAAVGCAVTDTVGFFEGGDVGVQLFCFVSSHAFLLY